MVVPVLTQLLQHMGQVREEAQPLTLLLKPPLQTIPVLIDPLWPVGQELRVEVEAQTHR